MMRKGITITLATLVGCVLLLLTIPFFIPMDGYMPLIKKEIEAKLGRDVTLGGDLSLSLLPTPSVTVKDISIATGKGGHAPFMVNLPKVRLDLGLGALLRRQIKLTHIKIYEPTIHLETLPNGEGNWIFHPTDETPSPSPSTSPEEASQSSFDLAVDEVELLRATLVWHNAQGQESRLEDLSTMLSMDTLMGPMDARGAFKALGRNIEFRLNMKKFTDKTPIKLNLAAKGLDASLRGNLLIDQKSFEGDLNIKSDLDDLEKLFETETQIPDFLRDPFVLTGFVNLSSQGADVKHMELVMEDNRLEGSGQVRLDPLTFACDLRGLPGGVHIHMTGTPQKGGLSGSAALSLRSARKFVEWTRLANVKTMPSVLIDAPWDVTAQFFYNDQGINFKDLAIKTDEASLSGALAYGASHKGLTYNLTVNASRAFLMAMDAPLKTDLGPVTLKGTTRLIDFSPLKVETDTTLTTAQGSLSAKGSVLTNDKDQPLFDVFLRASAGQGVPLSDTVRLQNLQISTSLRGDLDKLHLADMKASLSSGGEKMTLEGGLTLETGPKLNITGQMHASPLNLNTFLSGTSKQAIYEAPRFMLVSHKIPKDAPAQERRSPHAWSKTPLDFSWLDHVDAHLVFTCPKVVWSDWSLEQVQKTVKVMEGTLTSEASGTLWDGKFSSAFSLMGAKSPELKLRAGIDGASVQKVLAKVDTGKFKIVKGSLEQLTNLRTQGNSVWEFVNNLEGTFSLDVENGAIAGVNLKDLSAKIGNLSNIQGLTTLFAGTLTQGTTSFSQAKLAMEIHKGMGRIGKLLVHADAAEVTGGGTIDLPSYVMDVTATMALSEHPDFPPFSLRLSGPLDAPERTYDTSQIQAYMLQNVFSKLLSDKGGKIGDILSGVLGTEKTKSQDKTTPQDQSTPPQDLESIAKEPAKAIGGLLKGLL